MVACGTLKKLIMGDLLFAPCLKDLEGKAELADKHFANVEKTV